MKFEYSRFSFEKAQASYFVKICPVGVELFHANRRTDGRTEGRTDVTKLLEAVHNFENAPNNEISFYCPNTVKIKHAFIQTS